MSVKKLCRYLHVERQPLVITIVGAMGTGKTVLADLIYHYCYRDDDYVKHCLDDVGEIESINNSDKLYVVFDDFSYKLTGRSRADQEKLNKVFKIRHILNTDSVVLVFVVHYMRSLAVFLRKAQSRILTSISEPEIKMYSQDYLFTISALWDYLHYYRRYRDRYIVLYHGLRAGEHIIDVTEKFEQKR